MKKTTNISQYLSSAAKRQSFLLLKVVPVSTFIFLLLGCHSSPQPKSKNTTGMIELSAKAIPLIVNSSDPKVCWGYEIYADQVLYIKQTYVPSAYGYKGFALVGDALKAANMVITKLKNGQDPALDSTELASAGIHVLSLNAPQ